MATYSQKELDMLQTGTQSINDGPLNAFEKIAAVNRLQTRVDRGRERDINSYREKRAKEMQGLELTGLTYDQAKKMEKLNKVSDVDSSSTSVMEAGLSSSSNMESKDVSRPNNDFIKGSQMSLDKMEEYSGDSSEYESGFGKSFQMTEDAGIETPMNPSSEVANNVPSSDELGKLQIT
jgi:hypothetical protein|tara:strand:- start:734 stop:1267 length:534 start_codon:yes stop_codon:yes gene_type:complete